MVLILCIVCFLSTVGGILVGQSLKAMLIMKEGLEKGQRKMFIIGLSTLGLAIVLSLLSLMIPMP